MTIPHSGEICAAQTQIGGKWIIALLCLMQTGKKQSQRAIVREGGFIPGNIHPLPKTALIKLEKRGRMMRAFK